MTEAAAPGWYGKLPTLGDFASRRLPPAFIEPWDHWLAENLASWRERDPEGWLDAYLAGPSWRFVLMPGVLPAAAGGPAHAGVLVPSVDSVGRYFPFTLVQPLPAPPPGRAALDALDGWLHRLDDLAVDAMQDDWRIEQLEAELARLAPLAPAWPTDADGDGHGLSAEVAARAAALLREAWQCASLWFCDPPQRLLQFDGLPRGDAFVALFRPADASSPILPTQARLP